MTECPPFEYLLVIPRLRVQSANAISSPLTHGFPSMTAFLGLMWALERKTRAAGLNLQFNAVGVVAHHHEEQITDAGFVNAFRLTRNPVDKDGGTAAIVEEGRIHLDITLVFAVRSADLQDQQAAVAVAKQVRDLLGQMRIAGGTIVPPTTSRRRQTPYVIAQTGDDEARDKWFRTLMLWLLPGFALVERQDLLAQRHHALRDENPAASRLDAWLSLSRINWRYQGDKAAAGEKKWQHDRRSLGWIVPIPLGYGALGELQPPGTVTNARDRGAPFRFVESLYGIGQWLSPHRLEKPQDLLWYADSQPEAGLYRCRNDYRPSSVYNFD